ncbi:hypothetical protein DFH29DRAFT_1007394 [Suillus ampliporus]|nr:hypothetical protein DFH29DRAFT_1007394 [Suillus ampliporus]
MDILFVRWFRRDDDPAGFAAKRLQRLQFFDDESPDAYGFLDPDCVIRGVHIILGFSFGRPEEIPEVTIGRREADPDWRFYYVNMFVDRDMFMRFRGGTVGHKEYVEPDEDIQMEDEGNVAEELDDEEGDVEEVEADENSSDKEEDDAEDDAEDEVDILKEDTEDRITAEYGEVLDDDVLADEGYGAL